MWLIVLHSDYKNFIYSSKQVLLTEGTAVSIPPQKLTPKKTFWVRPPCVLSRNSMPAPAKAVPWHFRTQSRRAPWAISLGFPCPSPKSQKQGCGQLGWEWFSFCNCSHRFYDRWFLPCKGKDLRCRTTSHIYTQDQFPPPILLCTEKCFSPLNSEEKGWPFISTCVRRPWQQQVFISLVGWETRLHKEFKHQPHCARSEGRSRPIEVGEMEQK